MPDPFSLLGLVASILQFVDTIVKTRDYVVDFHDAPKDQRDFLAEVQSLEPLLQSLETRLRVNKSLGMVNGVQQFEEPLVRLKKILERLTKELDTKSGVTKYAKRLIWPLWRKKDIQDGLNAIERFKTLLGTWLAIGIWEAQERNHNAVLQSVRINQSGVLQSLQSATVEQRQAHSNAISAINSVAANNNVILQSIQSAAVEQTNTQSNAISALNRVSQQQQQDRDLLESIRGTARKLESYHDDKHRDTIIRWWSPINFFIRQEDIFNTR